MGGAAGGCYWLMDLLERSRGSSHPAASFSATESEENRVLRPGGGGVWRRSWHFEAVVES